MNRGNNAKKMKVHTTRRLARTLAKRQEEAAEKEEALKTFEKNAGNVSTWQLEFKPVGLKIKAPAENSEPKYKKFSSLLRRKASATRRRSKSKSRSK